MKLVCVTFCITMNLFFSLICLPAVALIPVTKGFEWVDAVPEELEGCVGKPVTFGWSYTIDAHTERILAQNWTCQTNVSSEDLERDRPDDVTCGPDAGVTIRAIRLADAGNYSVLVMSQRAVDRGDSPVTHTRTAKLTVLESPSSVEDTLKAAVQPQAVKSGSGSDSYHVQLTCGRFLSLGYPPVSVVWTTPSGARLPSTRYADGVFSLLVPNPVQAGLYSCHVDPQEPALHCVDPGSGLLDKASVRLDPLEARVILLEAQKTVETKLESLQKQLDSETQTGTGGQEQPTAPMPTSCVEVQQYDPINGVHTLNVSGRHITVFCDHVTDGGGWAVIQRRRDGSVDFFRNWTEYERGFGQLEGEFWIGLENLHWLTLSRRQVLRVDLFDFDGQAAYATYSQFLVGGPDSYYRLHVGGFKGNAGDSMAFHNYQSFTTKDADHDGNAGSICTNSHRGGWWYKNCAHSNLNGLYPATKADTNPYIHWYLWKKKDESLKFVEMKIKPQ